MKKTNFHSSDDGKITKSPQAKDLCTPEQNLLNIWTPHCWLPVKLMYLISCFYY